MISIIKYTCRENYLILKATSISPNYEIYIDVTNRLMFRCNVVNKKKISWLTKDMPTCSYEILLFEVEKNYKYAFDDPFFKIYKV